MKSPRRTQQTLVIFLVGSVKVELVQRRWWLYTKNGNLCLVIDILSCMYASSLVNSVGWLWFLSCLIMIVMVFHRSRRSKGECVADTLVNPYILNTTLKHYAWTGCLWSKMGSCIGRFSFSMSCGELHANDLVNTEFFWKSQSASLICLLTLDY